MKTSNLIEKNPITRLNKDYQNNLKDIQESNLSEKECSKCNKIQPISEFSMHLYAKDGYYSNCKTCSRIEFKKRYIE